jgi:glycosyltransferase involved in cell wall biosynthesis
VRVVRQRNLGLASARNAGLALCRGDFVLFLDADDRLLPQAIEAGARVLAANPSLGFTAGYSRFITADGVPQATGQPVRRTGDPYAELLRRNTIRNPAMVLFRRAVVEAAGGFAPGADACADYDLYLRISRDHPVAFHDVVVAEYRKHGANMSANPALMLRELLTVMRRQRPHLSDAPRRQAFKQGVRHIRRYYGDLIATEIRERVRSRSGWRRMLRTAVVLVWCHPAGAFEHIQRKIATWWRGRDAATPAA